MDNHPSCRRLHKIPAHTVKELWSRPQRLPPCAPTFPSLRAAHYSRLFRLVNTFFQGRFTEVNRCCRCRFVVRLRGFRRCEPPIMSGFSFPSTPSFEEVEVLFLRGCRLAVAPASGEGKYVPIRAVCEGGGRHFFTSSLPHSCWKGSGSPEPLVPLRPRPAARVRRCACRPAAGLRNRARTPAGHPPPPRHPPSPHAL